MAIRGIKKTEMEEAARLIRLTFLKYEAPSYSEKGIASFRDFVRKQSLSHRVRRGELELYGFFDPMLKGVIATKNLSHISLLFVDERYHRLGIATALVSFVKARAKSEGRTHLSVNSLPDAQKVYERWGFRPEGPEQVMDGLHFVRMSVEITMD